MIFLVQEEDHVSEEKLKKAKFMKIIVCKNEWRAKKKKRPCIECNQVKNIVCKEKCSKCYINSIKKEIKCNVCKLIKKSSYQDMCQSCYEANKASEKRITSSKYFLENNGYVIKKKDV